MEAVTDEVPLDPFAADRARGPVVDASSGDTAFTMVLRHGDLRRVAREWTTFSSDAPFRVPIPHEHDVRTVRQLPIESDPPDHGLYREVVAPFFSRRRCEDISAAVRTIADELIADAGAAPVDAVTGVAIPLQSRALGLMIGRPGDAEEWIGWGTHVFRGADRGRRLDDYIRRVLDDAAAEPGDDLFGHLVTAEIDGRPLTRDEMVGFVNLTFAGGRDTVINTITSIIDHLARHRADMDRLRAEPELVPTAVEEFIRHVSPLTHIGRVVRTDTELCGRPLPAGALVSLCFASANHDRAVFEDPDRVVLDRRPNRHLAFGHGPHTCLGAPLARTVLAVLVEAVSASGTTPRVLRSRPALSGTGPMQRRVGFDELVVVFSERRDDRPDGDQPTTPGADTTV